MTLDRYLTEERRIGYVGGETVTGHWITTSTDHRAAMTTAQTLAGREFFFTADELEEQVEGYLWQAADGSSVMYEVRRLV